MQTVYTKEEKSDTLTFPQSSLDDNSVISFTIRGQHPERSYEDRSVYLSVQGGDTEPMLQFAPEPSISMDGVTVEYNSPDVSVASEPTTVRLARPDFAMWLNGEDAIDLGMKLIEHGKFALEANMIQHQAIHTNNRLQTFLDEERVEELVFEMIDDTPVGYGDGFKLFKIKPTWFDGMAPEYQEDFTFDKVIYWSPFEADFADQLDYYTRGCSYSFEGYNHESEVRRFNESVRLMSGDF